MLVIKNGIVADLENRDFIKADILIKDNRIVKIGKKINQASAKYVDAENKYVLPGLIDMHAHLREPGREDEEDIESGSYSALSGGFTTICCMPNTQPPIDNAGLVRFIKDKADSFGIISVHPVGAITKERAGVEITEMIKMKEAGCIAFSDDGSWVSSSLLMRRAMEYSLSCGALLILHCEDSSLSKSGLMNEGVFSVKMGLSGIPRESEIVAVQRDIEIARLTGARVHFTHLSCKESVALIAKAKKDGLKVTADVTPHHLIMTEDDVAGYDTNAKVNPPLRTAQDRAALIEGIKTGAIDAIATDHAPHSKEEKDCEFQEPSFGMIGFERALAGVLKIAKENKIDIFTVIEKMSLNPARILSLKNKALLKEGYDADIIIVDFDTEWAFNEDSVVSKSKNSPFIGKSFKGRVKTAVSKGSLLLNNFKIKEAVR
ncbi:MAG: dihydroorotase [Candidatus Omnitrophica bacterium]|nr:dihydroorotase [Candidatus Omnitrophota bacterium]